MSRSALTSAALVSLLLAACGGSSDATTTTTTSTTVATTTTTIPLGGGEQAYLEALRGADYDFAVSDADALALGADVCEVLADKQAAGTPPGVAMEEILTEELATAEPEEILLYASAVNAASRTLCPETFRFAEAVLYWLGL